VSLPRLLLVDDSQAILAYETASLSDHYAVVTARSGRDALSRLGESTYDAVLLDLSMPEMDGDQVLWAMKADPRLRRIPVIIISTEKERANACIRAGAAAFLPKPIRADELRAMVGRVLAEARRLEDDGKIGVLFLSIAGLEFGVPLDQVRAVVLFPATTTVPLEGEGALDLFDFHGEMVGVLDLAATLRLGYRAARVDRRIVIVESKAGLPPLLFGLCVDDVLPPDVFRPCEIQGDEGSLLALLAKDALIAAVDTERGRVPVANPLRLFPPAFLASLPAAYQRARTAPEALL
jgi:CheY-like chemotaxis protein